MENLWFPLEYDLEIVAFPLFVFAGGYIILVKAVFTAHENMVLQTSCRQSNPSNLFERSKFPETQLLVAIEESLSMGTLGEL